MAMFDGAARRAVLMLRVAMALSVPAQPALAAHAGGSSAPTADTPVFQELLRYANALGMVRGPHKTWHSINRISFVASGSISTVGSGNPEQNQVLERGFVEMSYARTGMRLDHKVVSHDGELSRTIEVLLGSETWQETRPGIDPSSGTRSAASLRWRLFATPHGAIRAALETESAHPGSVLTGAGPRGSFIEFQADGLQIRVGLGADQLPRDVTMKSLAASEQWRAELTDYRDWELLDVPFPAEISLFDGDRRIVHYRVSEFRSNPYAIFPAPEFLPRVTD